MVVKGEADHANSGLADLRAFSAQTLVRLSPHLRPLREPVLTELLERAPVSVRSGYAAAPPTEGCFVAPHTEYDHD